MKRIIFSLAIGLLGLGTLVQAQDERSAADLYNEGVEKLKAQGYQEALDLFDLAIAKSEGDTSSTAQQVLDLAKKNGASAAYSLGNEQRKAKQFNEALATFKKGLELNELYPLYSGIAMSLNDLGKDAEATQAFLLTGDKYLAAEQPDDRVISFYKRAFNNLFKAKNWTGIIESAEKHPKALDDADITYYVAKAYEQKKDYKKALEFAEKATTSAPDAEDKGKYLMLEAELYTKLTDTGKAIEAYKKIDGSSKYAERAQYMVKQLGG